MTANQNKSKPKSRLIRCRPSKSQEALTRIAELEAKVAAFESRLSKIEKSNDNPFVGDKKPYTPAPYPSQPLWPKNPFEQEEFNRCYVCGLKFSEMTHYVCNHPSCPNRVMFFTTTSTSAGDPTAGLKGETPYTATTAAKAFPANSNKITLTGFNPITS